MGGSIYTEKMCSITKSLARLALGTVQFGTNYGVSNKDGITPEQEVSEILNYAWEKGISLLDTAPSYGISEEVIGKNVGNFPFKIVTKTSIFKKARIEKTDAMHLKSTFNESLKRLKRPYVYGVLIHHANDLFADGGEYLWQTMCELKQSGKVEKIGVSVYSSFDIDSILKKYKPDIIQLPINVFDQRLVKNRYLQFLKRQNIEIHSRSVFLQGLLLMPPTEIPSYFEPIKQLIEKYHHEIKNENITPLTASLAFVYNQPEIDYIIVGVNSKSHLREIIRAAEYIELNSNLAQFDYSAYAVDDEAIINPSLWRL